MEEIRLRDEQLTTLTASIQETLDGLDKSKRAQQDLDLLKDQLQQFSTVVDGFRIELKHQSPSDKTEYKARLRRHKTAFEELNNAYQWKVTDSIRSSLVGDHKAQVVDYESADGLMRQGLEVQDASKASLERTNAKVQETIVVGAATAAKLQQQAEQMYGMVDSLDVMGSTLDRSKRVLRAMARRVMTDRYTWVLILMVSCAIVFVVVWNKTL